MKFLMNKRFTEVCGFYTVASVLVFHKAFLCLFTFCVLSWWVNSDNLLIFCHMSIDINGVLLYDWLFCGLSLLTLHRIMGLRLRYVNL